MFRKKIGSPHGVKKFTHRGKEILRIEALSDAVFAFSVSLLVASLEVPQTFEELVVIVKGALPFFTTVALLFLLWYQQYMFFRYYGLNDFITTVLNLAYLALILFYVYPLKFLFSILLSSWTGINLFPKAAEKGLVILSNHDFPYLIVLFGAGYFFIWLLIFLLYSRAAHFSKQLQLNAYEILFTKKERRGALWNALVAAASIVLAVLGAPLLSGICYFFIPVLLFINQKIFRQQLKKQHALKQHT